MGSWITYGIGSGQSRGFAGLRRAHCPHGKRSPRSQSTRGSGTAVFCPANFQGVKLNSRGEPVSTILGNPHGIDRLRQAPSSSTWLRWLESASTTRRWTIQRSKRGSKPVRAGFPHVQMSVPKLVDISSDEPKRGARSCTARKAPRWHVRGELPAGAAAGRARRAVHPALPSRAGTITTIFCCYVHGRIGRSRSIEPRLLLIIDLKQRGMLDDTLVIWAGEFGRTPMAQAGKELDAGARSSHSRLFHLAGRRRASAAALRTEPPPTSWATTHVENGSSTSTTCTPRCSTCWGSITSG